MRSSSVDATDCFKRKKYVRTKQRVGSIYSWLGHPEGIVAKIIIMMLAEAAADMNTAMMNRRFREQGITAESLYWKFTRLCPEFAAHYKSVRGAPLTKKIVYDRFHKSTHAHDRAPVNGRLRSVPGTGRPGREEHYTECATLRPRVEAVRRLFLRGTPITLAEMREAGSD